MFSKHIIQNNTQFVQSNILNCDDFDQSTTTVIRDQELF